MELMDTNSSEPLTLDSSPGKIPAPFTLVIFGASGDLTRRKLIPAIYHLHRQNLLPSDFSVIGFARRDNSDQGFRSQMSQALRDFASPAPADENQISDFTRKLYYHQSTFQDPQGYQNLKSRLETLPPQPGQPGNYLFYLASQPAHFTDIIDQLNLAGLNHCDPSTGLWSRIIVEKPFGRDLHSARDLNHHLTRVFSEDQIFRIDHYLGKETVQNLLVLRFANSIFEPLWNNKYVDHVQITVSESIGVEGRGAFYEQAGALRDIVQNHIMHLLCLIAMEPPFSLDADAIRDEKVQVLQSLRRIPPDCAANGVIRAQYTDGTINDNHVCGYLQEPNVAPDSQTETFVAFKAMIDNWRWSGVPFYIRTGKRLPVRITEIGIHFKSVPKILFNLTNQMVPNCLTIRVQPREGIALQFQAKAPSSSLKIKPCRMFFNYRDAFGQSPPNAYERLLLDAALGDATLFTRSDEVLTAWTFLEPILQGCALQKTHPIPTYPAGSWGPTEADNLIESDGRKWHITKMPKTNT